MARVLIGNNWNGDLASYGDGSAWWMDHFAWFARDHDVLVLPESPDESFLEYVTGHTGVDRGTLSVVVPPADVPEEGRHAGRFIADPRLAAAVLDALGGRPADEVIPLWPDASVAVLAGRLDALP